MTNPTPEPQVDVDQCALFARVPLVTLGPVNLEAMHVQFRALLADRARHTAALKELVKVQGLIQRAQMVPGSPRSQKAWQAASAIVDGLEK